MSLLTNPVIALFLSVSLGYLIGRIKLGPIEIGGICGTLFVALLLGQLGVTMSADLKNTAFALFIFSLGFTAGPQFFANIRGGWRFGMFSVIEVVVALALTLGFALVFGFDPGTVAGIFAGSATESAVVGTASEAISHLNLPASQIEALQANVATAYSLTYLFGLVSIVVFATQIAPLLLRINLRHEAHKLAAELGQSGDEEGEGSFPTFVERAFHLDEHAGLDQGLSAGEFERIYNWAVTVSGLKRGDALVEVDISTPLQKGDVLFIRGRRNAVIGVAQHLGQEVPMPHGVGFRVSTREVILSFAQAFGTNLRELGEIAPPELRRGVFVTGIRRMGNAIPSLPRTVLQQGDVLTLYGPEDVVAEAAARLGTELPPQDKTDFVFMGAGIVVGLLIGHISIMVGQMDLTLGLGGGALVSGLVFGWINMRRPALGALPTAASNFAKDFGLAVFIAAVGLQAGPAAITQLKTYGLVLPVLGVVVSVGPALVSLLLGRWVMKLPAPILLGAIAGQHCSTPTVTALVEKAGNGTPVIGYTVTYAISNVILPLMGPVVVGLAMAMGAPAAE
ncbi:aspartate-alanine antiporter [Ottowia sp.]|uniref:aspartate-alanine antiporter n=1 Tax=Ottowia sp. TaxID=1898956 RepID=UPI003A85F447